MLGQTTMWISELIHPGVLPSFTMGIYGQMDSVKQPPLYVFPLTFSLYF